MVPCPQEGGGRVCVWPGKSRAVDTSRPLDDRRAHRKGGRPPARRHRASSGCCGGATPKKGCRRRRRCVPKKKHGGSGGDAAGTRRSRGGGAPAGRPANASPRGPGSRAPDATPACQACARRPSDRAPSASARAPFLRVAPCAMPGEPSARCQGRRAGHRGRSTARSHRPDALDGGTG
ncbi:hypothetical protein I4F81_002923 [Pyropia yezoensis]|uniref:Uncharacterized protein n=1 Tax=Pyropia yezoensis TaxID=2788 RepID=A0ACC3BRL3_PYRYE|nr:hypothetical protein I4F81_002923 [Neopyropia yezoensis]